MTFSCTFNVPAPTAPGSNEKVRMVLDTDTYNEIDDQLPWCAALPETLKPFMQPRLPMTGPPGPATGWRRL